MLRSNPDNLWRQLTNEMRRKGARRLLIVSGEDDWCLQQVRLWRDSVPGRWLTAGEADDLPADCAPAALRNLLGQEFCHAVFDARHGFHSEAFAALSGTLVAGSWLLLLVPVWHRWAQQPDRDSLRWSESDVAIATPRFVHHFQQCVGDDPRVVLCCQHQPLRAAALPELDDWQSSGAPRRQQEVLQQLLQASPGVCVVTAARGRGKSALAGMLIRAWPGRCLVTAPARVSTAVLARFAAESYHFAAPDALLAEKNNGRADWLIVDEAAAIPAPLLQQLVRRFTRVLLITTVHGYEGTGRGFLLKFCATLPQVRYWQLDEPLRWCNNDPLEQFVSRCLLLDEPQNPIPVLPVTFLSATADDWPHHPVRLAAFYQLLTSAHYRTTPLDLRRMMDAPGQHFFMAQGRDNELAAALWLVDEGGVDSRLARQVWAGLRRPRGNLVAQSLAANGGFPQAVRLRSRRISRIAVVPALRRQRLGQQLVAEAVRTAQEAALDYLSVSFGFTAELSAFWQQCGFMLARVGNQREASSGCYAVMAVLPLSNAGWRLATLATRRLARDGGWRSCRTGPVKAMPQTLRAEDWLELAGFAFTHRPFDASLPALGRLLLACGEPAPALRGAIEQRQTSGELVAMLGLSGQRALLLQWRAETGSLMQTLHATRTGRLRQWMQRLR